MAERRGRQSAAEQQQVASDRKKGPGRPPAPAHFSKAQAAQWREIVGSRSADWFTADTLPLLEAFIVHSTTASTLSKRIAELERSGHWKNGEAAEYAKLIAMRREETKAAEARARTLRLTPQSRWQPKSAAARTRGAGAAGSGGTKPWDE